MAKRKKTIIAGRLVKTIIYTAPEPQDGPRVRAVKSRMTTAAQKAMNNKAARVKLEMLLAANFGPRDLFVTLTYRDENLPAKRAGAIKMNAARVSNFFIETRAASYSESLDLSRLSVFAYS